MLNIGRREASHLVERGQGSPPPPPRTTSPASRAATHACNYNAAPLFASENASSAAMHSDVISNELAKQLARHVRISRHCVGAILRLETTTYA
ncbi:hypothetical protein KGM_208112 [Danaus plexippus plexippus]|uniref:Uncharacterized protein n=1 Tax=Danaus plexippus plexippus TaxID=278856 RepID=A0A212EQ23_DANPL|nr:hypothetical protein KGM_208112 [Danaus plexippus plexippus]